MSIAILIWTLLAQQSAPPPPPQAQKVPPEAQALTEAVSDANNSGPDIIRLLEGFLKKFPGSPQRAEIERLLARAAIDGKDDARTILYGERVLATAPDDMLLLDRVARALLAVGGRENAGKSLKYSRAFAANIDKAPPPTDDLARKQDERDRGQARALLFQSRAQAILGDTADAAELAARSYAIFPCEEAAREWGKALETLGQVKDAADRYADAFAIPDSRALDTDRAEDRRKLAELYRKAHHSEKGLGDLTLSAYDRTATLLDSRREKLAALDPNFVATEPMQFSLSGLDGAKLQLASLKGSVVVLDFWATWCVPCRAQHPLYQRVLERFKERSDVVFLSVDTDEDHGLVPAFLDRNRWSRKVYFEDGLQRLLQITSIPTTILFDRNGRVASRMNGFLPDKFVDQLSERIESALREPGRP
jgi:thiol-disulfide isomerase/thioredoxin